MGSEGRQGFVAERSALCQPQRPQASQQRRVRHGAGAGGGRRGASGGGGGGGGAGGGGAGGDEQLQERRVRSLEVGEVERDEARRGGAQQRAREGGGAQPIAPREAKVLQARLGLGLGLARARVGARVRVIRARARLRVRVSLRLRVGFGSCRHGAAASSGAAASVRQSHSSSEIRASCGQPANSAPSCASLMSTAAAVVAILSTPRRASDAGWMRCAAQSRSSVPPVRHASRPPV